MTISPPALGQRWISDAEPELGLGVLVEVDARTLSVLFPISEQTRVYARQNAPLTRIQFGENDNLTDVDGLSWQVESVQEQHGVLKYRVRNSAGEVRDMLETRLSPTIALHRPKERLLAAQADNASWGDLKREAAIAAQAQQKLPARGLIGARVSEIPHQLSVAHTVAQRFHPRVLLADEVGLGKTIEAGLIMHSQVLQGRAQRILLLVPDSLVHQWLVEMRRRFNLAFSLFDLTRCAALAESGENPFMSEQLILAPLDLLTDHPHLLTAAQSAAWDMLVVDEAHHLAWSPEESSLEYDVIASLAESIPSLLLLTATPEQLGVESHYARLHLLDPARYPSLDSFLAEHDQWQDVSALADALLEHNLSPAQAARLQSLVPDISLTDADGHQRALNALLDRHGLGRVLFRNTRAAVGGFPERRCHPVIFEAPECYQSWINKGAIWPETRVDEDEWLASDPRLPWLAQWLKNHKQEKCLLIARTAPIVEALELWLRLRNGIRTAIFHEGMSLLERDRAAAYFADPDQGAQILLCSEIGSEGRNFQFAHHLMLFDLPDNPDQLEQRIGRLDRIGQRHTIDIHVPLFNNSAQQRLFHWYHDALEVFSRCSPTASTLHEHFLAELKPLLKPSSSIDLLDELIERAVATRDALEQDLQQGRDRLLELQSCRQDVAQPLVAAMRSCDQDLALDEFMLRAWEAYGVHVEDHGQPRTWILHPGEHQLIDAFPGLDPEGMTVTADRQIALSHEDWQFLTWEHPMVQGTLELLRGGTQGNVQVGVLRNKSVKPGTLLLEAWYQPVLQSARHLNLASVLPNTLLRVLIDGTGRDLANQVAAVNLAKQLTTPDSKLSRQVLKAHRDDAEKLLNHAEQHATKALAQWRAEAHAQWLHVEQQELQRLVALRAVNPSVRLAEIAALEARIAAGEAAIARMQLSLYCVRFIIAA